MRQATWAGNISSAMACPKRRASSGRREQGQLQALPRGGLEPKQPGGSRRDLRPLHIPPARRVGARTSLEDAKHFVGEFRSAFPDLRLIIGEQLAEGDKVVSRGTIRGTHQGEFRGMAPTGEEMEIPVMADFCFSEEGKVLESWDSYDQLRLMRQSIEP
jgi:predicted ester cyclase